MLALYGRDAMFAKPYQKNPHWYINQTQAYNVEIKVIIIKPKNVEKRTR
jgi:hypothetical protein